MKTRPGDGLLTINDQRRTTTTNPMHLISDERNWLTWLVKVRLVILTVLLAIELAVIRLTPSPLPIMAFLTAMGLGVVLSLFFLFLVWVWNESRLQAMLQGFSERVLGTLIGDLT